MRPVVFPDLPGWRFEIAEVSAGAYRATGRDGAGQDFSAHDVDPTKALETCKERVAEVVAAQAIEREKHDGGTNMYGLIGRIRAVAGQREALAAILVPGSGGADGGMPGCLSYVVAEDPADEDVLIITEVWVDEAAHRASLQLPAVQAAIARGRPLIAGFDSQVKTRVLGGIGLR